ncbi:DUF6760 family protein [Paenibacillus contaminans]|uniref:DUF6760 domain-containing protein n=1 Tax=Paenibacillus contaminans TaxID=450362 RepID=A0A329LY73_9BACL|nr:hypothetical protein DQG23_36055 [Paenibacillus contaminans]
MCRRGSCRGGSLTGYPLDKLYEEVAFIAYYFHWPHTEIMHLEHRERVRWCEEISGINRKLNKEPSNELKL